MFKDREEALKRLEQALLEEDTEEEYEEECEEEYEEEEYDEESPEEEAQEYEVPQNPKKLIAILFLVTAGVLLFLAYLLARQGGLL